MPWIKAVHHWADDVFNGSSSSIVYPLKVLRKFKYLSYYETDTHWSEFGAYLAVSEVLNKYFEDVLIDASRISFVSQWVKGDLGGMVSGCPGSPRLVVDNSRAGVLAFNNNLVSHGRMLVYFNDAAEHDCRVLIFGSSSSNQLARVLSVWFYEVVFIYTAGFVDVEVLNNIRPDYIISQFSQRFVSGAARPDIFVDSIGAVKNKRRLNSLVNPPIIVDKYASSSSVSYLLSIYWDEVRH